MNEIGAAYELRWSCGVRTKESGREEVAEEVVDLTLMANLATSNSL